FPIALISAKLAGGLSLDEIPYWRDGSLEKYTPSGEYVVVKFSRWAFEKFKGSIDKLGTQMRAVGEVMSIGKTYKEAFQKAIRSLENGRYGLGFVKDFNNRSLEDLYARLAEPSSERQFILYEALRKGATVEELHHRTHIKAWFLEQMKELVELEEEILKHRGGRLPAALLRRAKQDGFADRYLAKLLRASEGEIRAQRTALGIVHAWNAVPVSGVENAAYYYSTYNGVDEVPVSGRKKVMILGGGPNRIGQGIEFDYCCVHAALALRELGYETIMVNCNPETVSTDNDPSDTLYFEPLTVEDVLAIYEKEKPEGVIVQFGGQTPLNIAAELQAAGVKILGTPVEAIALAEDRDLFGKAMARMGITMPEAGMASSMGEAIEIAERIGYPLIVRPSYVLGGRGMEVVHDEESLRDYVARAVQVTPERPILIARFLADALECEADALSDGGEVFVPAVMEHIEYAGVHSGDSACVIPPVSISEEHLAQIEETTRRIAHELGVVGLMNIQYAIEKGRLYVLEANPRASRTVPLVSKVCNVQMARLATELMLGRRLSALRPERRPIPHFGVKEAVFPFDKMPEVDPVLGPEMRSTGEVLGMADSFEMAFYKAIEAAKPPLPMDGTVLISLAEKPPIALQVAQEFHALGFHILSTKGTAAYLQENGIPAEPNRKLHEGRPHIADAIKSGKIHLVVNTPAGRLREYDDSYIRKTAIRHQVPYFTTLPVALACARGIRVRRQGGGGVTSLQAYHGAMEG
ncbi:MAG: carbamoyl-phosphate synthase large subunit, partial [Gemmatimonadetes bacterium]|nr:carbamoyl-phosphate synthase large subunit [Gemmatimonadota bacterium]